MSTLEPDMVEVVLRLSRESARDIMRDWDAKVKRAERRLYGRQAIRDAMEEIRGDVVSERQLRTALESPTFPWSRDATGRNVVQWELERWLSNTPQVKSRK